MNLNGDYRECHEQIISGRVEDWAEGPLDYNYTDVLVNPFRESMNYVSFSSYPPLVDFQKAHLVLFLL